MAVVEYEDQRFTGERALFKTSNAQIIDCIFADGESPLKESDNLNIIRSSFQWKYPLWYCENVKVQNATFHEMARAGIWYTNHIEIIDSLYGAPKGFRRCVDIKLKDVQIPHADETLWNCDHVKLTNVSAKGDYFAMNTSNFEMENVSLQGNYAFDGCKNVKVKNCKFIAKDAFWNCENVVVEDSYICGEYIGWNSKNLVFKNCIIESEQGFCYIDNLKLENCKVLNTNLAFEYVSNVDADIKTPMISIKNPINGKINVAKGVGEIIFDDKKIDSSKTTINIIK